MSNIYKRVLSRNVSNLLKNRLAIVLTVLLILTFIVVIAEARVSVRDKRQELENITNRCSQQSEENSELLELIECDDKTVIAEKMIDEARDEFDLIFPGERVIKIRAGE